MFELPIEKTDTTALSDPKLLASLYALPNKVYGTSKGQSLKMEKEIYENDDKEIRNCHVNCNAFINTWAQF